MATILVVDDLPVNRKVLVTLLRHQGHRLLEADNGSEALAVVRAEHPELVITDVLMPTTDGYEFVKQLRLDPATQHVPVVFCTAHYGEHEARTLAASSGVSHVLMKPIEPDGVLDVVTAVLAGGGVAASPEPEPVWAPEFDQEHLRLLTDKLSEKTENLRVANGRLRALIDIGLELAAERDADRLLQNVCGSARELFGATYVTVGILDRDRGTIQRVITCGVPHGDWSDRGDAVPGAFRAVVTDRQVVRGANPGGDPTRLDLPPAHPTVQAYLAVPISSPAHVYGWICLVGNQGQTFSDEDEQLAVALSGQVGRIYENSHFYRVAERRAAQLENEMLERRASETALRQERDRAQRYLDTAEVILLALDLTGRITLVNRYASDILGWTSEELLGRDWFDICLPSRVRPALTEQFVKLVDGDLSVVEHPVMTRSGEERLIEWRNTLVRDDGGRVVGTLSSGTDITERVRAVEELRTAEERMRFALQAADVGIWDMNYVTGQLRWSETLEKHYGLAPGTFDGTFETFVACIHPDDREPTLATIQKAVNDGKDFWTHHRALWSDGTVRWLSGAGRILLDERRQPIRGVGISLDVTERRSLEAQYQQAQKMEAIGRLAGGVAHDFNNLLTAILGYCELLQGSMAAEDPKQADVGEIQRAGTSAAALTRQLLAFSRKQITEPILINVNGVVSDLKAMLRRLIGEDLNVVLTLHPELARVMADRGQIEQIILNLAVNARDAMPTGGTLTIETANVEIGEDYENTHVGVTPGHYVALTITDTGTGMTPEVQARLFEPFFTTKEPGKGTGLGLATVHGIVTRNGGTIRVRSEIGMGTSFTIYWPQVESSETGADTRPEAAAQAMRRETVLVVDDAQGVRDLARRFLQRRGYSVLVATTGQEALQVFEDHPSVDLILTDVVMPGASGPELTRQLTERRPDVKVVYMSGYTDEAIAHHGVLNPGIAFLHKPFTSDTLERKIREVLV